MGDHEIGVDLTLVDAAQQVVGPTLDVGLAGANGQALVHHGAQRNHVGEPAVDPRHRDDPAGLASHDRLAQGDRPLGLQLHRQLNPVDHVEDAPRAVRLEPDRVDALVRAVAAGDLLQGLQDLLLAAVEHLHPAVQRLGQGEPLGHVVDGDHPRRAHHQGRVDGEQADRAAAPDRHGILRLDVAEGGGLPASRQDVRQENVPLVGPRLGDLDHRTGGEWHAHVLGLAARVSAGDMRIAEQARGGVAEEGLGQVRIAIGGLADGEVAFPALLAFAADHLERHDHPVADLEALGPGFRARLHDFPHGFVAHDVAGAHGRHHSVHQVQVRATDARRGDPDDRVLRVFDDGIGDGLAAEVLLALPADRLHLGAPIRNCASPCSCARR